VRPSDPEVIVLSPDLAANAVGRAVVFAELLRDVRLVTIAGWSSGAVHPLVHGRGLRLETVMTRVVPPHELRSRMSRATVIASKPLWRSYGWALRWSNRVVLDIDDPELALATADFRTFVRASATLASPLITAGLQSMRGWAHGLTVSSGALQTRFGGSVIPHARDETLFTDELRDMDRARARLGLAADQRLVAFVGTARVHKGIRSLLHAAAQIPTVEFAVVGLESDRLAGYPNVRFVPRLSYADAMRWVAAADVIVVPQLRSAVGLAQAPAKLVDAMAVGRAIVATDLPPIREICGDAALLYDPASEDGLVGSLRTMLDDAALRSELALRARRRFEAQLSVAAVRPRLEGVLASAEAAR